ncbi:hypothetical protein DIPPA_32501 [Diplonema papillatum]|nr:hypothetical protein DIPPA_32501 [Diplonema papillatum]
MLSAQGMLRFPAMTLFVFVALYQGFAYCGGTLVFHAQSLLELFLGACALTATAAFPIANYFIISKNAHTVSYTRDPDTVSWLAHFIVGPAEWIDVQNKSCFANRYGTMFQRFVPKAMIFMSVECFLSLAIGLISSIGAKNQAQCGHKKLACVVLLLLYAVGVAVLGPARRPRDDVFELMAAALSVAACFCLSVGHYHGSVSHWGFNVGNALFLVAAYVLLVRAAIDLLTAGYVALTKRKDKLRNYETSPLSILKRQMKRELFELASIVDRDCEPPDRASFFPHLSVSSLPQSEMPSLTPPIPPRKAGRPAPLWRPPESCTTSFSASPSSVYDPDDGLNFSVSRPSPVDRGLPLRALPSAESDRFRRHHYRPLRKSRSLHRPL